MSNVNCVDDPSKYYIGTKFEGLDAYERQLKRFEIVKGKSEDEDIHKCIQHNGR